MEELLTNTESQDSPIKKKTLNTEGVDLSVFQRKPLEETAVEQPKPKKTLNTEGVDISVFNKPKKLNTEGVDMSKFDLHKDVFTLTPSMIEQINQKSGSKFSTAGKDVMRYNSLDPHIIKAANAKKEDPNLIKFLMLQESRMRPGQTSSMGYYGLAQTNKATIETVNKNFGTKYTIKDMDDPEQAAMFIADYLKLARKFGAETWEEYIVAYNRGIGHVKTHKAGGEHPKETQGYLKTGTAVKDSLDEIARQREAEQKPEEKQELYIFDEAQEKYRVAPREKNIAFASGVSDVIVDAVQKYRQKIPKAQGGQFKYDTLSSRLNGFIEMFPEMAEEAKALREEMSKGVGVDALAGIEDRMKALEEKVSGVQEPTTMYVPGTGDMMQMFSRKNQHPNWDKYEQTIVNNPATRATQSLLENTAKMNDIMQMEETKRGTLVGRFGKGIIDGVIDEAEGYLKLGETIENNIYITRLVNKLNKAAESEDAELDFTPEEAHLLRALFENVDARERLDPQRFNSAYNWGLGFGKNMSFMAEFALTGGIRKVTQEAVERAVTRGIIGGAKNITVPQHVLARLAGIGVQSAYMPRVWRNAAEEASNGVPPGQALWNSYYENFTEVLSENLYTGKIVDGMHLNWYDQTMSKMGHALAGRRGMSGVMRALGEEFLEEKFAELAMAAKEHPNPKQFWLEFLPVTKEGVKSNLHTLGSVAIMTGILGSPAIAGDTSSSVWNKIKLNKIGKDLDAKIKGDIDIILDSGDKTSVAETYAMIFKRVRQAVEGNEIQGDLTQEVIKALNYAVEKTRNIALEHYADTKAFDDYRKISAWVKNIPVKNEGVFREVLAEAGIQLPANAKFGDIAENEALLTPEKDRTPEQKKFVQQINAALEAYKQKAKDVSEQGKMQAEAKDLQETIDFDTKQKARMEEDNKWAQERIDILNQKPELTEQEQTELKTLGTLIAENLKKLSDLETSMPENQKRLTEINTLLSEKQQVGVQEDTEKSPKSETDAEGTLTKTGTLEERKAEIEQRRQKELSANRKYTEMSEGAVGGEAQVKAEINARYDAELAALEKEETTLTKKETDIAEKARIVPKTFADLKRVGTEVFGLNKTQANAFAIITDRLIRNQAKRAGVSVEEMYATYDFRKADAKDLAEFVAEKDKASTEKQAQGARGAFILDNGKRVIFALTNPNVSTPMHEMAHAFEAFLTDAEKAMVLKWAGAKKWDVNTSEKFAKGFEKYLQEGKAPTPELAKVFENFKKWLLDIYNSVSGLNIELNPEMRKVYDAMLGAEQKLTDAQIERVKSIDHLSGGMSGYPGKYTSAHASADRDTQVEYSKSELSELNAIYNSLPEVVKDGTDINWDKRYKLLLDLQQRVWDRVLLEQKAEVKKEAPKVEVKEQPKPEGLTKRGEALFQTIKVDGVDTKVKPVNADVVNGFYSPLEKVINETKLEKLPVKQWLDKFGRGEEAKWTGLQDWLIQQTGSISKSDIQKFLKENRVQIVEKVLTDPIQEYEDQIRVEEQKIREDLLKPYEGNPLRDYHFVFDARESVSEVIFVGTKEQAERVESKKAYYASDTLEDLPSGITDKKVLTEYLRPSSKKLYDLRNKRDGLAESQKVSAKFMQYTESGEFTAYKEILVLMPEKQMKMPENQMKLPDGYSTVEKDGLYQIRDKNNKLISQSRNVDRATEAAIKYVNRDKKSTPFISSHFKEPNILVHLRMNTRKDVDGNKVLFLEEIQSDWGQKGRKQGFVGKELETDKNYLDFRNSLFTKYDVKTTLDLKKVAERDEITTLDNLYARENEGKKISPQVPAAPFVTDTNSWIKLGFKVALKEAVKQKVKKIAWTTGTQQNDRYDLSKQVDKIEVSNEGEGIGYNVYAFKGGEKVVTRTATASELPEIVGKELAQKIIDSKIPYQKTKVFSGLDLEVGGEGMKAFYGDGNNIGIIGKVIESVTKQKIGETKIKVGTRVDTRDVFRRRDGTYGVSWEGEDGSEYADKDFKTEKEANDWFDNKFGDLSIKSTQHSIEVTPDLTQQVETGLPLFQTLPKTIEVDGVKRPTTNSKGQQIHPTEEGVRNFWKWFSGSRVVDDQGRPLVVYHGTGIGRGFDEFKGSESDMKGSLRKKGAIYFHSNPEGAKFWAETGFGRGWTGSIVPVYLKLENPNIFEPFTDWMDFRQETNKGNYDGVINDVVNASGDPLSNVFKKNTKSYGKQFIVFEPNQIKSATGNLGTFSPETGNILFQTLPKTIEVDGVKRPTTNSKGQQIHPTEEGVKNFWKWFKNSAATDKDGKPLVVYHGSVEKGVTEFDTKRVTERTALGDVPGTYFTTNQNEAGNYTRKKGASYKERGTVYPAYLKIENPLNTTEDIKKGRKKGLSFGDAKRAAVKKLTPEHDGIVFEGNNSVSPEYVVFDPTQIKSATGNLGTFSPETGNILFQTTPDLASKFPAQDNADNQKKQDRILTKMQNDFDAAVKYISDVINKQPEEAKFVTYNGKTYAVIPTKVAGRKGFSVVNMEDKGKSGKGVIVGTGFIKKNVLSAAENPANTMTREEALGRIQAYLEDRFTKDAQAKIDKNIAKIKPAAKEKESVEVKPISSVEDLIDRIKIERNAVKDFQKVIEAVLKMIVESKSKQFITPGQFNSIMRRLQYIKTDKDRSAALDYVQDIVLGAHYKDQLSQARTFIKQLKKATDKLGEGIKDLQGKTIRAIAKEIIALDPKTMTVEDLEEFNRVAAEIDIRSANPRMWPFQQLSNIIDRIEETDAELKVVTTEDIVEAIEDYRKKYTKETLVDRKTIVAAQRALARIRNKATDLLIKAYEANTTTAEGATTELGQLISEIGKLEDGRIQGGEIQEMIEQEKKNYIQQVKDNLKKFEKEINYTLSKLNEYKKKHALSIMGTTVSDLEKLNLAQVEMFDRFIYNLAHGYMTPAAAFLEIEIGRNRIKDQILTKFFSNVKNSKQFNQWVDKYYNGGSSKLWSKDGRKFKPKLKWRNFNVQQLLQEQIWSRQAHRIDTWLGNYDKDHAIGSVYNFIGRGVSTESITSIKYDEKLYTAWNNLLAHYSATMRGEIVYEKPANRRKREQMMSWIGMVLTEKSYQAMDVYDIENVNEKNVSIMHNNYGDKTSNLEHNTQEPDKKKFRGNTENYKAFMDMLRKRGATKIVKANKIKGDGTVDIEVMDVEKAEQILREIKPVSKYIDTMYEILEDMRGMAEWSAYANGRGFVGLDSYMPFFVIRNNKMLDVDKIRDSMNIGRRPAKMQAGATYERTGDVNYIEIDPQTIMKRYIQEISRNYHVYGEIKKAVGAVMDAGNEAIQEEIDAKSDKPIMRELTKVIVADMKLRLDNFYGMNSFTRRNSGFRAVVKSVKIGLLAKIHRPLAEFGANAPRAIISIGALPMDAIKDFKQNKEAYELLIEDFIGERYISRWGEEIRGDVFRSKVPKALEQGARWIVTWADTAVGRPLFVHEFRANFKALSGQEFDSARFQTDITYRVDNESYIERAATRGVRKVEELFNEKAPITAPTHIRFWGGLFTPRVDSPMAQYFGFLMSFSRNEMAQVADSIRRIRFSPYREDKAQGYRDLFAITASNAMYGIFRHASMILVEGAAKLALSALGAGGGDDEMFNERLRAIKKWRFYVDKFTGSTLSLGLGGSAPLSLYAYKVMMAIMDKGKILTEEQRQKIKDYMAAELYVRHIPERGRREDIISAALPVPSALTDEIFRFEGDLVDAISILGIVDREVTDEQQKMAIISLFLTGLKFGMPNPVTPTMQHIFEKERRRRLAELKNQGSENPELDLFNEMYENTFDDDMLYKEIEQLEQFNDLFER